MGLTHDIASYPPAEELSPPVLEKHLESLNIYPTSFWDGFVEALDKCAVGCAQSELTRPLISIYSSKLKVDIGIKIYRLMNLDVIEIVIPNKKYTWVNGTNRIVIENTYKWGKGFNKAGDETLLKSFYNDTEGQTTGRNVVPVLELLGVAPDQNWDIF